MAYGSLVHTLEAHGGAGHRLSFGAAVAHILHCALPLGRFHAAGAVCQGRGITEGQLSDTVDTMGEFDLNPFLQCMLACSTPADALRIHAAYMERSPDVIMPTRFAVTQSGVRISARQVPTQLTDLRVCREVHVAAVNMIATRISRGTAPPAPRLELLVERLHPGVPAVADACAALDAEPAMGVARLAAESGCRVRTLQRTLARAGVTAESLRRAAMLLRATGLLRTRRTLTDIAHDAGYADLAHMTRAFVASCSVAPSTLRAAMGTRPAPRHHGAARVS